MKEQEKCTAKDDYVPCQKPALTDEGFNVCFEHLSKDAALVRVRQLLATLVNLQSMIRARMGELQT